MWNQQRDNSTAIITLFAICTSTINKHQPTQYIIYIVFSDLHSITQCSTLCVGAPAAVDQGLFANLHAYVQINPQLAPIAERLQLKRLVPMAVDQAIVEIITPVVERSVTIACMTAQELIVKVNLHAARTATPRQHLFPVVVLRLLECPATRWHT